MQLSLGAEMEEFIQTQVDSGLYGNAAEVIHDALCYMKDHKEKKGLDSIRTLLAAGEAQLSQGEEITFTSEFMEHAMQKAADNSKSGKPVRDEVKSRNT